MVIAVVGATGRTGGEFVNQAIAAGHKVIAYVRRPEAVIPIPGLSVVEGQIDEVEVMSGAFSGCDAVVITLGPKISQASAPLMSIAVPTAIQAAQKAGVKRILVLSALGVGATLANTRYPYRLGCRTFLKGNFIDHNAGESQLADSSLNWTTFHPGPLFNGEKTAFPMVVDAVSGTKMARAPRTMRADVAAVMLKLIDDPSSFGKQILISSVQSQVE